RPLERCPFDPQLATNWETTRRQHGTWSRNLSDRGRCDPHLCGECDDERREHRCRRLDPDGRRARQHPAVTALLAVLGGPRLLVAPSYDLRRRRTAAHLLGREAAFFSASTHVCPERT